MAELGARLLEIASRVKYRTLADVGCDHGYLPIYLARANVIDFAVACDLNAGPLECARRNIREARLSEAIETRLGAGLAPILPSETEAVVIAGMGGVLIADIISEDLNKARSFKQLLLQPQKSVVFLRRFLHANGFKIDGEGLAPDGGQVYNILEASAGSEEYDEAGYLFGRRLIDERNPALKPLVFDWKRKSENTLRRLTRARGDVSAKIAELERFLKIAEEVLSCL